MHCFNFICLCFIKICYKYTRVVLFAGRVWNRAAAAKTKQIKKTFACARVEFAISMALVTYIGVFVEKAHVYCTLELERVHRYHDLAHIMAGKFLLYRMYRGRHDGMYMGLLVSVCSWFAVVMYLQYTPCNNMHPRSSTDSVCYPWVIYRNLWQISLYITPFFSELHRHP